MDRSDKKFEIKKNNDVETCNSHEIMSQIISLHNDSVYRDLMDYFGKTTVFNVLGVERSETRHSAFICWLLNVNSCHSLGSLPLRKFLALYAKKNVMLQEELKRLLVVGNYEIDIESIDTEKCLKTSHSLSKDRFDVFVEGVICYRDSDTEKDKRFVLLIENKVYSKEGDGQTDRYHALLEEYVKEQYQDSVDVFEIYLSPQGDGPLCKSFVKISYQDLLDDVIEPLLPLKDAFSNELVADYIRVLSRVSLNEGSELSSILATSKNERSKMSDLFERYKVLFEAALSVREEKLARQLGLYQSVSLDDSMLRDFYDKEESLMVSLFHNEYGNKVQSLFKCNNRDNTKYQVCLEGTPMLEGKYLPKSKAARAIFMAYMKKNPATTLDELRKAFPIKINSYYDGRYFKYLFYRTGTPLVYDCGPLDTQQVVCKWDFDLDVEKTWKLFTDNGKVEVTCVKMWRKHDFESLLDYVQKNYPYITVNSL